MSHLRLRRDVPILLLDSKQIVEEYIEIVNEMISRKQGKLNSDILLMLIESLEMIKPKIHVKISRDPDDDKFKEWFGDNFDYDGARKIRKTYFDAYKAEHGIQLKKGAKISLSMKKL